MQKTSTDKPNTRIRDVWNIIPAREIVLATLAVIAFLLTVQRPGNFSVTNLKSYNTPEQDLSINTSQVLTDVENMSPSKLLAEGHIEQAVVEIGRELKEKPYDVRTVMCAGNVYCAAGDKNKGLELLKKATVIAPQSRYTRLNYAQKLLTTGNKNEAIDQYKYLCKNYPKAWVQPWFELAEIYLSSGQPDQAIENYQTVLETEPNNNYVAKRLALATAAANKPQEGFDIFEKACSVETEQQSYAYSARAILQRNDNSSKKAIGDMKIEVATKPKQLFPRISYAELLLYLGRPKEAKDVLLQALELEQASPDVHMALAQVALKLGDREEAMSEFSAAAKLISTKHP